MAAADPQIKETASRCTMAADKGAHTFEIVGYSLKKGMGAGKSIHSGKFSVGGVDWVLRFCPDGLTSRSSDHPFIHLELATKNAEVRAHHNVTMVKRPSGARGTPWATMAAPPEPTMVFGSREGPRTASFKVSRTEIEAPCSGYLHDDCLVIRCEITVFWDPELSETTVAVAGSGTGIDVPPPDMAAHLGKLFEEKEGADVTFSVEGESIVAHKFMLAARSPVFKAELCGPMKTRARCVVVEDMRADVFRVLLHFIYNDSLPEGLGNLDEDDYGEMIQHLLVAADRYAMERLKLMCQDILGRNLDVENVAATLGLADQYNCDKLKDVCIEFMSSAEETTEAVLATEGYASLKRSCPSVIVEVYERATKRRRI
ncbi:unnamed protein product [Urochloa decumbens]|uniref:Uncharacterized protein n=1 Tax=Urochloa decumbens TaxID=240449 RepID=A0ABC9BTY9_9POAL